MKMKITYHRGGDSGEWTSEEHDAIRRWDRMCALLTGIFLLSAAAGLTADGFSLRPESPACFTNWFLFFCSFPMLALTGLCKLDQIAWVQLMLEQHMLWAVLGASVLSLILLWILGRFLLIRWMGAEKLNVAGNFLLILAGWGIMQLMIFGTTVLWRYHSLNPDQPAQVEKL